MPVDLSDNVPSGTCVDSDELLLPRSAETILRERELREGDVGDELTMFPTAENSSDFFIVPQGGLKGTSNGVLYRVILNENAIFRNNSDSTALTNEILQQLIYSLSFIYGK